MKKTVYFVRHGEKQASSSHNSILKKELELTNEGVLQAELAGRYLASVGIIRIYSSNYKRAVQTSEKISEATKAAVSIDSRFGERVLFAKEVGIELAKKEFLKSQSDWDYKTKGGESLNESVIRFSAGVDSIVMNSTPIVAVVAHGRVLQSYFKQLFSDNRFSKVDLAIGFCDIYKVEYQDGMPVSCDFVFSPLSKSIDTKGKVTTLAQTLVMRPSDNKIIKTHLFGDHAHNIQFNIYEKTSLDFIAACGIPVPKNIKLLDGGKWLTMNYVGDDNLGVLLSSSVDVKTYLKELGGLVRKFHDLCSKDWIIRNGFSIKKPDPLFNAQCALNFKELTLKNNANPPSNQRLNYKLFKTGVELASRMLDLNPQYLESPDVVYGDLKPDNVLIQDGRSFLIDPLVSYGRRSCDLGKMVARLYLTDFESAEDNIGAFFEGYQVSDLMKKEIYNMASLDMLNAYSRLLNNNLLSGRMDIPSHERMLLNMEKCLNVVNNLLEQKDNILILRHLNDVQDFRVHYRNTPIIKSEKRKVPKIAKLINDFAIENNKNKICFVSSEQIRASDTARIVKDKVLQLNPKLCVGLDIDNRIKDLYHGEYSIPDDYQIGEKLPALAISTKCYIDQTFNKRNIDYRNGDTCGNKYPELRGLFRSLGENQREFSIRFYNFMADFLTRVKSDPDTLFVIVAHTAIAFRLFELSLIVDYSRIDIGDLTFEEWSQASRLDRDPGNQLFISPGEVKRLDLVGIVDQRHRFKEEARFLRNTE